MIPVENVTLVASFGTTHESTCEKNITAVEIALAEANPNSMVMRAFTSSFIRKALAKRGIEVDGPAEALAKAAQLGCRHLTVVPTHILPGDEYEKAVSAVEECAEGFESVTVAKPLMSDHEDYRVVLGALAEHNECAPDEALVLMGHGSEHFTSVAYAAIAYEAAAMGLEHVIVGTVEGYPTLEDAIGIAKGGGYKKALITPLMLVAGDHAVNDMASDEPGSWKSSFAAAGIEPRCLVKGLGEYAEVRDLYCKHMLAAANG